MYHLRKVVLIGLIVLLILLSIRFTRGVSAVMNTWITNGPAGENVDALVVDPLDPSIIYAGTSLICTNSVTPTHAGGISSIATAPLPDPPTPPPPLDCGTSGGSVFKSANGGEDWSQANTGLPQESYYALAIDQLDPDILYAAGKDVYKSMDGGGHWTGTGLTDADSHVTALVIDPLTPTNLYAVVYTAVPDGADDCLGVFKSTDGGVIWANIGLKDNQVTALAIDPRNPTTLYAGIYSDVVKSTNGGGKWYSLDFPLTIENAVTGLTVDPVNPNIVYAQTKGGLYKSMYGGGTWSFINLTSISVGPLVVDPINHNTVYAATPEGVFRSVNGGETWMYTGLADYPVNALAINPLNPARLYAGTYAHGVFSNDFPPAPSPYHLYLPLLYGQPVN